ncbi:MAG: phospho-N-acetylmuramoyl-pentapeptide-transferase [Filifactoraceae bacterium]
MNSIGISFIVALVLSFFIGPIMLPTLTKLKFGQTIREDGPQSHLSKNGTPTMGGLVFIFAISVAAIIGGGTKVVFPLAFMLLFGLVGFVDDYIKVVKKQNLGLRAYQKIIMQILFATLLGFYQYSTSTMGTEIIIPFFKVTIDLGILYIPFIIFFLLAVTNGTNLTDGLDGLATKVTIPVALSFAFIAYSQFNQTELACFMVAVAGGLLGFLRVNRYPAKVFMGDVGSMALGGAISASAVILNLELLILIVGIIYVLETCSVIIQVVYFKVTSGKRFFRMAPLHHHFEEGGMSESKVVTAFVTISWIASILGILSMI